MATSDILTERSATPAALGQLTWIYGLFFVSGCPALIYQIVWQRALFAIYGINIQSVTIVVAAFMLGLGLGSLIGGRISQIDRLPALPVFGTIELCVGAYGMVSLHVFRMTGAYTAGASLGAVAVLAFLLVLIPTVLMGGTLPFLVAHFVRASGNVGSAVGMLYFVNTLGSAFACMLCARFLMNTMGESGSVSVAAALNGVVGLTAFLLAYGTPQCQRGPGKGPETPEPEGKLLAFPLALVLAGLCGFISLSYEIVWYRAYSFVTATRASAFALLLAAYLEGIAMGSLVGKALCLRRKLKAESRLRMVGGLTMAANLAGFLVVPLMARMVQHLHYLMSLPMVAVSAALLGALFPLTTHLAVVPDGRAGSRTSLLYFANIIGSTGGTALVGFVLMDYWSMQGISVFLLVLGLALGGAIYAGTLQGAWRYAAWGGAAAAALVGVLSAGPLFDRAYERMLFKSDYPAGYRFAHLIESKSGVVAVGPDGIVFGGGIYDGRFHTSLVNDTNGLLRAYAISAFHPAPKQVLMIGLSSGSWAQVIANNPAVEHMTVVEINPDYLKLIAQYPEVASILHNPKITIEIDDGRRWLFRHQESRFDLVVMNTTFNWRAHITNLLSVEFLQLVRRRLRDGGVLYYNTTGSEEVLLTGTSQFPFALRILNFLALSDRPLTIDREAWRRTLVSYRLDGKPVLDLTGPMDRARLDEVLATADSLNAPVDAATASMEYAPTIRSRCQNKRVITDDNMGTEWYLN